MAQVIIRQTTPDPLVHALVSNFRRRPLIREACSLGDELVLKISHAFHEFKQKRAPLRDEPYGSMWRDVVREFYDNHCKVFTCNEGNDRKGGFAILHGELIGLHNVERGCGDWMMRRAIDEGAVRLQCIGTPELLMFYNKHGFAAKRVEANRNGPEYPMVYTMELGTVHTTAATI